jgi:phosphotransferase system HPr (HPr) family protein
MPTARVRATLPAGVALHARPAGRLVRAAAGFQSTIEVAAGGKRASARSILALLALGAAGGTELALTAEGADAEEAAAALVGLIEGLAEGQ